MTSRPGPLSPAQIDFFFREGYLVAEDLFTDADFAPLRAEITAAIDREAQDLMGQGRLSRSYAEEDFEHRLARIASETDEVAQRIWDSQLALPAFFHLIRHPRLLDVAEQLCGEELIASSVYRLRPKLPGHARGEVPWHQDSGYFEPFCDDALVLTVWLPLVDAVEENGCLWVMPRLHRRGILRHTHRPNRGYLLIHDKAMPGDEQAVCVPVKKGSALLMTNMTPHASFANRTDAVRWSMDLRYQSAALPTNAPVTRLAGELSADPDRGVPPACYPPEADFLVRSRRRPGEVLTDPAAFARLRQGHQNPGMTRRWVPIDQLQD